MLPPLLCASSIERGPLRSTSEKREREAPQRMQKGMFKTIYAFSQQPLESAPLRGAIDQQ